MQTDENMPQQNGQQSGIHYSDYYAYLMQNPWIQQAIATYDWTKHSNKLLESTLDRVESGVTTVAQTATQKALDAHQNYYVRPKEAVTSAYNAGKEKTMYAVETSKNVAIQGGTVSLGAAVVATQLGLALSAGGANLILNTIGGAQNAGQRLLTSIRDAEKMMEEKIWSAVAEGQRVAQIPVDKLAESTNAFLDVVSVLVERSLGVTVEEVPDSSVKDRVSRLAHKIVEALSNKAHTHVIDPLNTQLHGLLEHLSKSFILADLVREKREWALEKVEELSSSVSDLKTRFENEAKQYSAKPEELLMKSIRTTSVQLRDNLEQLKDNGQKIFGDGTRVESLITYLQELDKNLGESNDIYQVRDEVLSEARQRLAEVSAWTTSLLTREKQ
ncbi:hypothetical protein Y032_0015g2664 [Ancylostoma ceylanicum]|uniref:Uncharacterized protein n=1 Tax=Ancylostoma ceylanicum TaxID=53326 RepID=A0A016V7Q9_9BILA|nr:hypothetical protein Y032_0015g2664 [Ancylostoma ceylanicum]